MKKRNGAFERATRETRITIFINIDEPGKVRIDTPIPFLGHMLDAFACHGRFSLTVKAEGDIEVDPHHLMEDTGIALGGALRKVFGDFSGIRRSGFALFPMDGSLAQVALDLCGRPNLVWRADLGVHPIGGVEPKLFRDFFKGLVDQLGATLHVAVVWSDGDHHSLEAIFKGFGRALRDAAAPLAGGAVASTKGVIGVH